MNKVTDINVDEEIDLSKFFTILLKSKMILVLSLLIAILFASLYLRTADSKYTVVYKLKDVSQSNAAPSSSLGALAAISGIPLPNNTAADVNIFKELIYSIEVSKKVIENKELTRKIFINEWDSDIASYTEVKKSTFSEYKSLVKSIITGKSPRKYVSPNAKRLSLFIKKNIQLSQDKKTGFLRMSSETSSPETILLLMLEIANNSDDILREKYKNFSIIPLEFYKLKLNASRAREHRQALAQLISKEEQKLMLASSGKYFAVEPITKPEISLNPTSPKPVSVLLIAILSGLMLGTFFALVRHRNER